MNRSGTRAHVRPRKLASNLHADGREDRGLASQPCQIKGENDGIVRVSVFLVWNRESQAESRDTDG